MLAQYKKGSNVHFVGCISQDRALSVPVSQESSPVLRSFKELSLYSSHSSQCIVEFIQLILTMEKIKSTLSDVKDKMIKPEAEPPK